MQPVWPEIDVKSSPNFPRVAQKVATVVFFQNSSKSHQTFGVTFERKFLKIAQSGHTVQCAQVMNPMVAGKTCLDENKMRL